VHTAFGTRRVGAAALVALVALAVHGRTIAFGLVDLDDRDLVVDDHAFLVAKGTMWRVFARSFLGVVDAGHSYYRPVVAASLALDARWSGVDARGYHLSNVVIYCAAAALFHELLRALRMGTAVALVVALAFAVHPAWMSTVAWIPGRNDGLLAVFVLAAWLCFARDCERPSWGWRSAHFVLFALSLFTKETAIVLPLVCVAHGAFDRSAPGSTGLRHPSRVAYLVGWVVLAALRVAARPPAWPPSAVAMAPLSLVARAWGTVVMPYEPTTIAAVQDLPVWPGLLGMAVLGVAATVVPGVRRGVVGLGATAFCAFLLPAVAAGGSLVVGSRLVLPACGIAIALAEVVRAAARETRSLAAGGAAVVAGLASFTAGAEGAFRDPRAFAVAAVAASPHCALAHVCLGRSYQIAGQDDRALEEYRQALALGPAEIAHNNVAVIYMARSRWGDAEQELEAELSANPRYARAHRNLAVVLRHEGRLDEACAAARRAMATSPGAPDDDIGTEVERDCGQSR
jgi:hypothetical protein